MKANSYTELMRLETYNERLKYLQIGGMVGASTFGSERFLNQGFYHSTEWRKVRDLVIVRDLGCDLAIPGLEITESIYVHHMIPITLEQLERDVSIYLDPEFLITCSFQTHQAIHYGSAPKFPSKYVERSPNDTCPWK